MNKRPNQETDLFKTIMEHGKEEMSQQFSKDLQNLIVEKYNYLPKERIFENKWLGKTILSLLLAVHLILLYFCLPSLSSFFIFYVATIGFLIGLWGVIFLFKNFFLNRMV